MRKACWLGILILLAHASGAQQRIDSLKQAKKNDPKEKAPTYLSNIAQEFLDLKKYDSALVYYHKSYQISKGDKILTAANAGGMATAYGYKGLADSSIYYYITALEIYDTLHDALNSVIIETNLAFTYKNMGWYEKALEYSFDAISKLERRKPDRPLASSYNTVAGIYKVMKDYANAILYYNRALRIRKQINYVKGIGQSYNNIGETYIQIHNYDSALIYLTKSLKIKRELKEENALGTTLNLMGEVYLAMRVPSKAESYLHEALLIKEKFGDRTEQASVLNNLAKLKLDQQQLATAQQFLSTGERHLRQGTALELLLINIELNVRLYKALHQYPKALQYADELLLIKDSLLNKDKAESLIALQTRYETEKKEQQIQLLQQDKVVQQVEIDNKKIWIQSLIITIFLVTVIGLLIYLGYRASQRNKRKVENLLKEMHHRVKNNLQILSSILSLQSLHLTDTDAIQAIKSSESRMNTMALIHKKLYKDESNRSINIREYISELCSFLLHSYGYTLQTIQLNITGEAIMVDVDKAIPIGLILNELISNSLKYAYPQQSNPSLDIHFQLITITELQIEIKDNGKGLTQTEQHKDTGSFGLKMVNTLMKELKGKITVTTKTGTSYTLQLPLYHG